MADHHDSGFSPERRGFLNALLGSSLVLWLGSVLYPITRYLVPPRTATADVNSVKVAGKDELAPGDFKIFRFGTTPGIVFRLADGSYRALSARCTHLNCTVQFQKEKERIWCACHNGVYDINGRNVSGPPPRPLERYEVVIKGDAIYARKEGTA